MLPVIEQVVFSALTNSLEGDDIEEALATFLANQRSERDRERRVRSALEREHTTVTRHLTNLIAAIAAGIAAPEIRHQVDMLSGRKADLEAQLSAVRELLNEPDPTAIQGRGKRTSKTLKAPGRDGEIKTAQDALPLLVKRILVRRTSDHLLQLELFGPVVKLLHGADAASGSKLPQEAQELSIRILGGLWFANA